MTDKIRIDNIMQDWYTENYGKIDTVTYTTTIYEIPKAKYNKLIKSFVSLKDYNFSTAIIEPIVLIEYIMNNEYQLNWITINGWYVNWQTIGKQYFYTKDNKSKAILKWLHKYI